MTPFDKFFNYMTQKWVVISFIIILIGCFLFIDQPLAYFFFHLNQNYNFIVIKWITKLGIGGIYIIGLFLLALFFRYILRNPVWEKRTWFVWFCVVIPSILCVFIKISLGRARPILLFEKNMYGFYWLETHASSWSFPSGHTTTIMGLVFGLSVVFPRYCYALISTGILVAISRVILTNHYLSDIIAAFYLTLLEVGMIYYFWKTKVNSTSLAYPADSVLR